MNCFQELNLDRVCIWVTLKKWKLLKPDISCFELSAKNPCPKAYEWKTFTAPYCSSLKPLWYEACTAMVGPCPVPPRGGGASTTGVCCHGISREREREKSTARPATGRQRVESAVRLFSGDGLDAWCADLTRSSSLFLTLDSDQIVDLRLDCTQCYAKR